MHINQRLEDVEYFKKIMKVCDIYKNYFTKEHFIYEYFRIIQNVLNLMKL